MTSQSCPLTKLPELVANILQHVTDRCSLQSCARVNKLWSEEAVAALWSYFPSVHALAALENPARIQHYANHIRFLFIRDQHEARMLAFSFSIRFPRLVWVQVAEGAEKEYVIRWLQPRVKYFVATWGNFSDQCTIEDQVTSPHLQALSMRDGGPKLVANTLLKDLSKMDPRGTYKAMNLVGNAESDAIFLHLASNISLEGYMPGKVLTQGLMLKAENLASRPFCVLRYLHCQAESMAVTRLLTLVSSLRTLHVHLLGSCDAMFLALKDDINLEKLELQYDSDANLSPSGLITFASRCSRLIHLEIYFEGEYEVIYDSAVAINDHNLEELASLLPDIQTLWLCIPGKLTVKALLSLAEHCKRLDGCYLYGDFELLELRDYIDSVLFPRLRRLHLANMVEDNEETVSALLGRIAPQLRKFHGSDEAKINWGITIRLGGFRLRL